MLPCKSAVGLSASKGPEPRRQDTKSLLREEITIEAILAVAYEMATSIHPFFAMTRGGQARHEGMGKVKERVKRVSSQSVDVDLTGGQAEKLRRDGGRRTASPGSSILYEGVSLSVSTLDNLTRFDFVDGQLSLCLEGFSGKITLSSASAVCGKATKKRKLRQAFEACAMGSDDDADLAGCTPFPENEVVETSLSSHCPSLSIACGGESSGMFQGEEQRDSPAPARANLWSPDSTSQQQKVADKPQGAASGRQGSLRKSRQVGVNLWEYFGF